MPLNNTANINFSPNDYTSAAPAGGTFGLQTLGVANISNVRWANKTRQIDLGNTDYGYVTVDLSCTITGGTLDTIGVSFYNPQYLITYNTELSGLFKPVLPGQYIKITPGITTRLYIIVNYEDKKYPFVPINIVIGKKGTPPTNVNVTISYNCTDVGPLYQYLVGMHTYSAYDAINNPTLQTYLYSYTPIGSWTTNTEIYSKGNFTHPAYPYYYGYSGNVYKVGGELERSFGIKKYYEAIKWNAFAKVKIYDRIQGPKSWIGTDTNGSTTENFVFPTMTFIGRLRQILPSASIPQPSSYRYYLGTASNAQESANFFTQFDFTNRIVHTIPGFQHAIAKLSTGFLDGYKGNIKFDINIIKELVVIGLSIIDALIGYDPTLNVNTIGGKIRSFLIVVDQLLNFTAKGSLFAGSTVANSAAFVPLPIPIIAIVIAVAVVRIIIKLFTPTKAIIEEPSITFKYRYANAPYLNNGTRLYTNTALSTYLSEYYCDGIYFYDQTAGTIANKELSYSTNALLNSEPLTKGISYSTRADLPDSGSIITDLSKLIALPYCSGKPDSVSGTNKNTTQTVSFSPLNKGGDLLTYPLTVTVEIPEGTITTTGSQALANTQAQFLLNELTASYAASGSYGQTISGIGGFGADFTHEIKIETYPNTGSVFFNNNDENGLIVGKPLYYDNAGYLKVFNGYYAAVSGALSGYGSYRTFFKTNNGNVTDILTMGSSGATTVTSLVNSATYPVQTSNQGLISDWFWYNNASYNILSQEVYDIVGTNTNPNSLYTTASLKAGFVSPNTSSFFTYDSISSTASYSEASSGYYYTFNSFEYPYFFAYNTATTLSINLTEVCFTDYSVGEPYGVNISGASGSASSSLYYPVNMTLEAYNGGTLLASFPATASAEGITYVDFPAPITKDSNVTNVTVASISSPNPNNKILYVGGSFTNCNPTTPAPTTAAPTTAAPTTAAPTTAAPTTAAPTTAAPTTAAPTTPAPTTPAPTAAPPSFSFLVNNVGRLDGELACATTSRTRTLYAYDSDFSQAERFYTTNTFPYEIFDGLDRWYSDGVYAVQINTLGYAADMIICPTPSPTTAPTTAAPTTPPTPPPTNPPTTPPTPPPTNPPTPAPTAPFSAVVSYSTISAAAACSSPQGSFGMTGNNSTFCNSSTLTSPNWVGLGTTSFWVAYDGQVRQGFHFSNTDNITSLSACAACPTPSPTTAPTTAAPTTPPTPPPTNPPTPPPTTPPTPPPTPAPTAAPPPYSFLVTNGRANSSLACITTSRPLTLYSYDSDFSLTDRFYSTNTFPYTAFNGNDLWYSDGGSIAVQINTSGFPIDAVDCPTPSPTNPPTPPPTPPPTTPPTPPPTNPPTTPPTPPPTNPPTPPPTNPPTPPPTTPPTPPPTTPPTPPPTTPPTPPPTPSPTEIPYYYYDVRSCFNDNLSVARSLSMDLNGVYAANGTCYIIQGVTFGPGHDFTIDAANLVGGSCFVEACGYTPPPVPPPTSGGGWSCEAFVGCYEDPFSFQSYQDCISTCPQP